VVLSILFSAATRWPTTYLCKKEKRLNWHPAAVGVWWLSAWEGSGRRSWAGRHNRCSLQSASGSLWTPCYWPWQTETERGKFSSLCVNTGCSSLFRYSQQLLQCPLLERLVGAVHDVGIEVVGSVVLNNIANVPDHWVVMVTPLKVLKKPEN